MNRIRFFWLFLWCCLRSTTTTLGHGDGDASGSSTATVITATFSLSSFLLFFGGFFLCCLFDKLSCFPIKTLVFTTFIVSLSALFLLLLAFLLFHLFLQGSLKFVTLSCFPLLGFQDFWMYILEGTTRKVGR